MEGRHKVVVGDSAKTDSIRFDTIRQQVSIRFDSPY